jgi:type I restriction-modification system DNA methylase subunit
VKEYKVLRNPKILRKLLCIRINKEIVGFTKVVTNTEVLLNDSKLSINLYIQNNTNGSDDYIRKPSKVVVGELSTS